MDETSYGPNDGPLMRWAINHANDHFTQGHHPRNFHNDLQIFRERRDGTGSFSALEWPITIDGVECSFQMSGSSDAFNFNLEVQDTRIYETHVKPGRGRNGHNILSVSAGVVLAQSVIESLIGQTVDNLIELQPSIHGIISGRPMKVIRQDQSAIMITLA